MRERCEIGDDVVIGRGSLVENDTTIGATDEDPGQRLRDRVLHARGRGLHRPRRDHDERQLHGPHGEAARAAARPDDPPRRPRRAAERFSARESRSARRRSSAPGPSSLRDVPARAVVVGNPARKIREVRYGRAAGRAPREPLPVPEPVPPGARSRGAHDEEVPAGLRRRSRGSSPRSPATSTGRRGADGRRPRLRTVFVPGFQRKRFVSVPAGPRSFATSAAQRASRTL